MVVRYLVVVVVRVISVGIQSDKSSSLFLFVQFAGIIISTNSNVDYNGLTQGASGINLAAT